MSPEEEGVHKVPRESGGRAGESKQGAHRGAEESEGAVLYDENGIGASGHAELPTNYIELHLGGCCCCCS